MKNLLLCIASLLTGSAAFAQTTVATDPVGFINITVKGGSISAPKVTLLSPTLTQPIVFQGTIANISGTTINVNGVTWTAGSGFNGNSGSYYVEVFSATKPGALSDIVTTGVSSVTTHDDLSAFATTGDSIRIRQHVTLDSLFGANNTFGLLGSSTPGQADEVYIYDGITAVPYFYLTGDADGDPAGWYDSAFTFQAGGVPIYPHDGVLIKRRGTGNVTITATGTVKTGNTLTPVKAGPNLVGTISAQGLTLDSSGLYTGSNTTGVVGSSAPGQADEVIFYDPVTGNPTPYFYLTGDADGDPAGWYDSAFTFQAGATPIAPGSAFLINRKSPHGPFNWVLPSPTSF